MSKKIDMLDVLNGIDPEFIEEAAAFEPKKLQKKKKTNPWLAFAAAAVVVLSVIFSFVGRLNNIPKGETTNETTTVFVSETELPTTEVLTEPKTIQHEATSVHKDDTKPEQEQTSKAPAVEKLPEFTKKAPSASAIKPNVIDYNVPDVRDLPFTAQFPMVVYNENAYSVKGSLVHNIDSDKVGKKLAEQSAYSYNYSSQTSLEAAITLYEIKNIKKEYAVGIKFAGDSKVYPYINDSAKITSMKDIFEFIEPKNTLSFGEVSFSYSALAIPVDRKVKVDSDYIYKYILCDMKAENLGNKAIDGILTISVNCDRIGATGKKITVSKDGYISTDLMCGTVCTFYIGEENVKKFVKEALDADINKISNGSAKPENTVGALNASPRIKKNGE